MPKKGNLFLLVKSLSKSEKRYFKLSVATGKQDSNYLQLFDAIEKQKEFDEEKLREHFKDKVFSKQLHVAKIYLSELILKSLRNFHTDNSIHAQLLDLLRDIEILFRKELYDNCSYRIDKAQKLAMHHEKGALLLEVLGWKRKLIMTQAAYGSQEINTLLDLEKNTAGQLLDLNQYWHSTFNLFKLVKSPSFAKELDIKKATTLQALTLHHHLLYSFYFMNGQVTKAEQEISKIILHLEKHPARIEDEPGSYVTAIGNKIGFLLRQKRWNEAEALIQTMRAVPVKYKLSGESKFTVRLWLRTFNLEMEVYRDTRQLTKGLQLAKEIEAYLEAHQQVIPEDYKILLCYQMAGIYFLKGSYSKSLYWTNEILNTNFGETRNEIQCYARILNLMVHFELNNIIILRYAVDSSRRFFKKKKQFHSFEEQVLLLFSRLSHAVTGEYRDIVKRSYDFLYKKKTADYEAIQDYIDLKGWMENRVDKK